jgi:cation/acetate symporter
VQVVGAGALVQILFGIDYTYAVTIVSVLMVLYVSVGGMLATTWVQITKAVLLLMGITLLAVLTLNAVNFDFTLLYEQAHAQNDLKGSSFAWLSTAGGLGLDSLASLSLGLGLVFGLVGSPHLLMRFFTVPDAKAARTSAAVAMTAVVYVNLIIFFVVGVATVALLNANPEFFDADGRVLGGENMVAIHLARLVGGNVFYGVMAAIAFATILAVVAGLTLASASSVSHDIYARVIRKGKASQREEIRVFQVVSVVLGLLVILLGIAFEGQNVAYLVSLALAVAASTNFPLLILTMYWRDFTTQGAICGGVVGLVTTIVLMVLGPAVWVTILGFDEAAFPSAYPALYSMVAAFAVMIGVSLLTRGDAKPILTEAVVD